MPGTSNQKVRVGKDDVTILCKNITNADEQDRLYIRCAAATCFIQPADQPYELVTDYSYVNTGR